MGLFSKPVPPLDSRVSEALSSTFRVDVVGAKKHREGLDEIARRQEALLNVLGSAEQPIVVLPIVQPIGGKYEGVVVLSNQRLFECKRGIEQELELRRIVRTELSSHPGGFIILEAMGPNYVPYPQGGLRGPAFEEYRRNHLQVNILGVEIARHFVALVDGERSRLSTEG